MCMMTPTEYVEYVTTEQFGLYWEELNRAYWPGQREPDKYSCWIHASNICDKIDKSCGIGYTSAMLCAVADRLADDIRRDIDARDQHQAIRSIKQSRAELEQQMG